MEISQVRELTINYSGTWGINHVDRLLKLIKIIGQDQTYDEQLLWLAAHLHDWGAYQPYVEAGKDHAIRSREVLLRYLNN